MLPTPTNKDYTDIDRPYDNYLERSDLSLNDGGFLNDGSQTTSTNNQRTNNSGSTEVLDGSIDNGSVETQPVKSDGGMADLWITNLLRSQNWKPKKVGFMIDGSSGYAEFTSVYISGHIQALTGHIGGWIINDTSITDISGLTGMSSAITGGDDIRFWAGDVVPSNAEFSVTESGIIKATSGTIGGCVLSSTSIGSTIFTSGPLGSGWNISNTGVAEFQNVSIRGIIKSSVFEKDTISAINGIVVISKSDILNLDMTALDSSTLTISGESSFINNEVIRIKDATNDEYMLVTDASSAPLYVVIRDLVGTYTPNNNPIWKKGTAVVSMGVGSGSKTGYITLDSSSTNSPFIDIYSRNSNTYSDINLKVRLGWLKGIVDTSVGLNSTDVWGLYSDNVYLKGTIVASSGTIGGFNIGTDYIKDAANSFGLASTISAGIDTRFWAGDTFSNRAIAPFRIDEFGNVVATSLQRQDFHYFTVFESLDGYGKTLRGAGTASISSVGIISLTGANTNDNNEIQKLTYTPSANAFSWDRNKAAKFSIGYQNPVSDTYAKIGIGCLQTLTTRHIGFTITNGNVYGSVADNTTETSLDLSYSLSSNTFYLLEFRYVAGSKVDFYIDNTLKGTITTNLPTGKTHSEWLFDWHIKTTTNSTREMWLGFMDIWQAK